MKKLLAILVLSVLLLLSVAAAGKGNVTTAFAQGIFTASDGTVLPYRYYLPEGYEASKNDYPVFLYMHGNSSRGTDNQLQLTSAGTPLQTAVFESRYECIMIAPQCPTSSEWSLNGSIGKINTYPGTEAYAKFLESGEPYGSKYFCATAELLDMFIREYKVDTSRIYVHGTSNGGGAVWNLVALYPEVFAAAVPVAGGYASKDYVHAIAHRYVDVPIWAFHGDSDTTVPVSGTRTIVNAIEELGGELIKYTEVKGGTHGNIWKTAAQTHGLIDWIFAQRNENFVNTLSNEKAEKLDCAEKLAWNGDTAVWSAVENAGAYKVSFYADGVLKKSCFTHETSFTPAKSVLLKGECTFTVRAFPAKNSSSIGDESNKSFRHGIDLVGMADFTADGFVTAEDITFLAQSIVNGTADRGDLDNNGYISLRDILVLVEYMK